MKILKNVVQKLTAMIVVFVMTIADFSLIGKTAISYAIDIIETNNKNVVISAYFENQEGEKYTTVNSSINGEGLKLKVDVSVKNGDGLGGYFDGDISLSNSNFKFKDNNNTTVHVNAESTATIEKEIIYQDNEDLTSAYLSQESQINIAGKYVNSKKSYDIEGKNKAIASL